MLKLNTIESSVPVTLATFQVFRGQCKQRTLPSPQQVLSDSTGRGYETTPKHSLASHPDVDSCL